MRFLIVGAGATGGFLGAHMIAAGLDASLLVRPARAAALRRAGLNVQTPFGNLSVSPHLLSRGEVKQPFDVVLLAVKAYQLDQALTDLGSAVSRNTMILPVLNGIKHLDEIASHFAPQNLMGCTLKVSVTCGEDGTIVQHSPIQELAFGELDGTLSQRSIKLRDVMSAVAIETRLSSTIRRELWEKWTVLAAAGAMNCLMRATVGEIVACAGGREFAVAVLDEAIAIAAQAGEPVSDEFALWARELLIRRSSNFTSSMYQDLAHGRPIEAEQIIYDLLRRGKDARLESPLLSAAAVNLQTYEARLALGVGS